MSRLSLFKSRAEVLSLLWYGIGQMRIIFLRSNKRQVVSGYKLYCYISASPWSCSSQQCRHWAKNRKISPINIFRLKPSFFEKKIFPPSGQLHCTFFKFYHTMCVWSGQVFSSPSLQLCLEGGQFRDKKPIFDPIFLPDYMKATFFPHLTSS